MVIMKKIVLVFLALFFQFANSQTTKNMGDFSSVKVYDKIAVVLIHSNENMVEIVGDDSGDIEIVNKNGELKIRMATTKVMQGDGVKVKVFYDDLNEIQASQGSEITSENTIETKMLSLTSNEGSVVKLDIDVDNLTVKVNSGGELTVAGKSENQNVMANSGGKYFGKELDSKSATINANAGGNAEVNVKDSVNATTRAGGEIDIFGNPENKQTKKILGGIISFQ